MKKSLVKCISTIFAPCICGSGNIIASRSGCDGSGGSICKYKQYIAKFLEPNEESWKLIIEIGDGRKYLAQNLERRSSDNALLMHLNAIKLLLQKIKLDSFIINIKSFIIIIIDRLFTLDQT